MVISVEPGIYLDGVGGFRHSDTVLVTADGCESLTGAPEEIDELVIRGARPVARSNDFLVRRALQI